jgi:hypothetical protein
MDQTVYGSKSVAAITKAPPLAVIPYIESSEDQRQRTTSGAMAISGLFVVIGITLVTVHLYYKPLDVILYIVLRKLGIELGA